MPFMFAIRGSDGKFKGFLKGKRYSEIRIILKEHFPNCRIIGSGFRINKTKRRVFHGFN